MKLTPRLFLVLLSLYVAQGLPFGFFTQAVPTLMRENGVSLQIIGLLSLLALPWALKFLWAPLLDRYQLFSLPHRKGWILCANVLAVLSVLLLASFELSWWMGGGVFALMSLLLLVNFAAASQDISTDALAVETIDKDQRGLANALQVSGYRVGMVLGGGLILGWLPVLGWQWAMAVMAFMLMLFTIAILFLGSEATPLSRQGGWQSMKGLFNRPHLFVWLGFLLLYKSGDAFGTAMLRPMLVDAGLTVEDMAWLLGTWGVVAGLLGAVLGGLLIKPLGRIRALKWFLLLQGLSMASYAVFQERDYLYVVVMFEHVAGAMATIALFTVMMDFCRESHAGLDYSFQSSLIIISGMICGALSGFSAQTLGYEMHFLLAGLLSVLVFVYLKFFKRLIFSKGWL